MPRLPGRIGKAVEGAESSAFATFKSDIEDKIAATRTIIAEIRANLSESTLKMNGDKIQEILSSVSALFSINKYTERKEREDILKWISNLDVEEFHQICWFPWSEIPLEQSDPQMHRFIDKALHKITTLNSYEISANHYSINTELLHPNVQAQRFM